MNEATKRAAIEAIANKMHKAENSAQILGDKYQELTRWIAEIRGYIKDCVEISDDTGDVVDFGPIIDRLKNESLVSVVFDGIFRCEEDGKDGA